MDGSFLWKAYRPQALEMPVASSSALVEATFDANPSIISQNERIFATAACFRPNSANLSEYAALNSEHFRS